MKDKTDLVKKHPTDIRLSLYAHGKQGKFGDNKDPKPGMFNIKEKYKWEAWKNLEGMDQNAARKKFLELSKMILGESK